MRTVEATTALTLHYSLDLRVPRVATVVAAPGHNTDIAL